MRSLILLVILFSLLSCRVNRQIKKSINAYKFTKIDSQDSIAYAKFETSNIQYKLFLNSQEELNLASIQELRVRTEAWTEEYTYAYQEPMQRNYFKLKKYDQHPVVNINFIAAKKYCEWLTQEYQNDKFYFRLPTKSEYLKLLETVNIKYDSDNPEDYSEFNFNMRFDGNYPIDGSLYTAQPNYYKIETRNKTQQSSYTQNKFGIKNIVGNVSEFLSDGTYIGGSWDSFPSEVLANKKVDRPLPTVGFRVIKAEK